MIATAGDWDHTDRPCYFLAANLTEQQQQVIPACKYVLIAVHQVRSPGYEAFLERMFDAGVRVLLDSGVYGLAQDHARRHGVSMDVALGMPPTEMDGFDQLWQTFTAVTKRYGDRFWGYIELDQGGADNKRKTRRRLEDLGLAAMPVYHPLNDGWDYFDELADGYDRICWGNIVHAKSSLRLRMLATMEDRRAAHPDLWIHVLGLTPNEWCNGLSMDSTDSTEWLSTLRWSGFHERAMLAHLAYMAEDYRYLRGDSAPGSPTSDKAALAMAGVSAAAMQIGWRHWLARLSDVGLEPAAARAGADPLRGPVAGAGALARHAASAAPGGPARAR